MEADSIVTELQNFFSKATLTDWEKIARQEINGKNPFEILSWRGKDDILFLPYYDSGIHADPHFLNSFQLPAASLSSPRNWLNVPMLSAENPETANANALVHLQNGADGILFDLRSVDAPDLNKLTNNIQWEHRHASFFLRYDAQTVNALIAFKIIFPALNNGALFWESIPKKNNYHFYLNGKKNFKSLGVIVNNSSPANEIAEAVFEGVKVIDDFSDVADIPGIFSSICFSLTADASFFETLAKFKALRILWYQVAQSYGLRDYRTQDVFLQARVKDVPDGAYSPHENMLKATFAAIAATLGGCDVLTIENDKQDALFGRWSRNVSAILREESFFQKTADPTAGSWALDAIVNDIAASAWQIFQKKWSEYAAS